MSTTTYKANNAKTQLQVERTFDAPLALVWKAWTTPALLDQWWAPKPWKARTKHMDFTEGGDWLYCMEGPGGEQHWSRAVYSEIVPETLYVGTDCFCDETGALLKDMPQMHWHVSFQSMGEQTRVEVNINFERPEDLEAIIKMGFREGFSSAHENLDSLLLEIGTNGDAPSNKTEFIFEKGRQDYFVTREFDAPPALVFRAFTEPQLLEAWFMPKPANARVEKMDCRTGGSYCISTTGQEGKTYRFEGVYHEVLPGELLVKTMEFKGLPQKVDAVLEFTRFEKSGEGRTKVRIQAVCPSEEYRDNMVGAQMEPTFNENFRQLDNVLESIRNT